MQVNKQLCLLAQDLHKIKPIQSPIKMGRGSWGPTPARDLLWWSYEKLEVRSRRWPWLKDIIYVWNFQRMNKILFRKRTNNVFLKHISTRPYLFGIRIQLVRTTLSNIHFPETNNFCQFSSSLMTHMSGSVLTRAMMQKDKSGEIQLLQESFWRRSCYLGLFRWT